jgi:alkaline phosphatase D
MLVDGDGRPPIGADTELAWEVATDELFDGIVAAGTSALLAAHRHTARVTVDGLPPGLLYYRFRWDGAASITGRTRTTAPTGDRPYRIGVLSCQHFEEGWFVAHRALRDEQPDLVVHLGDYVYDRPGEAPVVRSQSVHRPADLADYRTLYDEYRRDPDLQGLHAAAPVVAVWDDHEVKQNDAGTTPDPLRAAAYRAWWEQQAAPLPPPDASGRMRIHRRVDLGALGRVWLLDGRQYRSPQVCGRLEQLPAHERCADVDDPTRTMLGDEQEAWLAEGIVDDGGWDLIGQQTVLADLSIGLGGVTGINNDQWDGYAPARDRLVAAANRNPRSVVLSGDLHAAMVNLVDGAEGERIPELVTPAATTRMPARIAAGLRLALGLKSRVRTFEPDVHGYFLLDVSPDRIDVQLRGVDPLDAQSTASTVGRWELAAGSRVPRAR